MERRADAACALNGPCLCFYKEDWVAEPSHDIYCRLVRYRRYDLPLIMME